MTTQLVTEEPGSEPSRFTDAELQAEYSDLMDMLANTPKSMIPADHLNEYDRLRSEARSRGVALTPDVDLHN